MSPRREFQHQVAMAYIDLDELPGLLGGRLLRHTPGPLRFRRRDYHGDPSVPLRAAVQATVREQTGLEPAGPIRVLTTLSTFGACFNPVSFYYCFEPDGETVAAVLAEVTNTPWRERHAYVTLGTRGSFDKALHVSPFMGMDQEYRTSTDAPGQSLSARIENHRDGRPLFAASLTMSRRELTPAQVRRSFLHQPLVPLRTLALIYGHAVRIRLAGVRTFPHPDRQPA
jgi:DUF1365 family protein